MKISPPQYRPSEHALLNGPANLQRGIETVGGWLFLTDQRLIFKSHEFNVQKGATEIALRDIASTTPCWTKVLNLIPLAPNSLAVSLKDGTDYRFVLNKRSEWKQKIDDAVEQVKAPVAGMGSRETTIVDAWEKLEQAVSQALGIDESVFGPPASDQKKRSRRQRVNSASLFPRSFVIRC